MDRQGEAGTSTECIVFGDVRIDPGGHRIHCAGEEKALEPKAYAVLLALVRQPGKVIGRTQLLDMVWGHRHVTPCVLNRAIAQIRHATNDHAEKPRYIQTVHTLGYRFIGKLESPAASGFAPDQGDGTTQQRLSEWVVRANDPAGSSASQDSYALGRRYLSERTRPALEAALQHFRAAIAADPGNARAWCGIADSHLLLHEYGDMPADHAIREARQATAHAHGLQLELAEAYSSQGLLEIELQHYRLAICLLEQSLQIDPALAHARAWLATALTLDGQLQRARRLIEDALPHEPGNAAMLAALSMNLAMRGKDSGAEQVLAEIRLRNPAYLEPYWQAAWVQAQHGHFLAAARELSSATAAAGRNGWTQYCLARVALLAGLPALATEAIRGLPGEGGHWNIHVECCWALGRWEEAVQLLSARQPSPVDRTRHAGMLAHSVAGAGRHSEAIAHYEAVYPGYPLVGDRAILPWELNLGLGECTNLVALLDGEHPRRAATLSAIEAHLLRLRDGGVCLPVLDYLLALLFALRGEPQSSLHWLDRALDSGFLDAQAFSRELAWRSFDEPEALDARRQRMEARLSPERQALERAREVFLSARETDE